MDQTIIYSSGFISEDICNAIVRDRIQTKLSCFQLSHKYGISNQTILLPLAKSALGDLFEERERLAMLKMLYEINKLHAQNLTAPKIALRVVISRSTCYKLIHQLVYPTIKYKLEGGQFKKSNDGLYLSTMLSSFRHEIGDICKESVQHDSGDNFDSAAVPFSFIEVVDDTQSKVSEESFVPEQPSTETDAGGSLPISAGVSHGSADTVPAVMGGNVADPDHKIGFFESELKTVLHYAITPEQICFCSTKLIS